MTIRLLTRTEIRNLAKDLDFRPRKALGQNFVHDANTLRRIVSSSGVSKGDHVLEVGPGLGSLTLALLDRGAEVTAVEIDSVLAERLPKTIASHSHSEIHRLTVLNRDILGIRRADLKVQPTALVANLPYNIAVPALLHLLAEFPTIRTTMVMVQSEVADRLGAPLCVQEVGGSASADDAEEPEGAEPEQDHYADGAAANRGEPGCAPGLLADVVGHDSPYFSSV